MLAIPYHSTSIAFEVYAFALETVRVKEDFDLLRGFLRAHVSASDAVIALLAPKRIEQFKEWGMAEDDFPLSLDEARDLFLYSIGGSEAQEVDRLILGVRIDSGAHDDSDVITYLDESQWVCSDGELYYHYGLEIEVPLQEALAKQLEVDRGKLNAYYTAERYRKHDKERTASTSVGRDYQELHNVLDGLSSKTTRTIQVKLPEGVEIEEGAGEFTIDTI